MNYKVKQDVNIRSGPGTQYDVVGTANKDDLVLGADPAGWVVVQLEQDEDGETGVGWIKGQYVEVYTAPIPQPVTPTKPVITPVAAVTPIMGEPAWITWAKSKLGEYEGRNPEIDTWFKYTTLPESMWDSTQTPWCSVFCCAAFEINGIKTLKDARAISWLNWGVATTSPRIGDVAVFDFGNNDHHVALVLDVTGGMVHVVGGNQSNAVTLASYSAKYVMGYRRVAA